MKKVDAPIIRATRKTSNIQFRNLHNHRLKVTWLTDGCGGAGVAVAVPRSVAEVEEGEGVPLGEAVQNK